MRAFVQRVRRPRSRSTERSWARSVRADICCSSASARTTSIRMGASHALAPWRQGGELAHLLRRRRGNPTCRFSTPGICPGNQPVHALRRLPPGAATVVQRRRRPGAGRSPGRRFRLALEHLGVSSASGRFAAHMIVSLVNDGPYTILVDTDEAALSPEGRAPRTRGRGAIPRRQKRRLTCACPTITPTRPAAATPAALPPST